MLSANLAWILLQVQRTPITEESPAISEEMSSEEESSTDTVADEEVSEPVEEQIPSNEVQQDAVNDNSAAEQMPHGPRRLVSIHR